MRSLRWVPRRVAPYRRGVQGARDNPGAPVGNRTAPPPTEAQVLDRRRRRWMTRAAISSPRLVQARYEFSHQQLKRCAGHQLRAGQGIAASSGVTQDTAERDNCTCVTNTATCSFASTARPGRGGRPLSVNFSTRQLSASLFDKPELCRRSLACAPPVSWISRPQNPDAFNNSGSLSVYGWRHATISRASNTAARPDKQYFVSGRYFGSNLGIENPTPANEAIHDRHGAGKGFLYLSTVIDPTSRLTFISACQTACIRFRTIRDSRQTSGLRRVQLRFIAAQRTTEGAQPVQRSCLPEIGATVSTTSFPTSTATASCTSFLIRSAIWLSTAWLPMFTADLCQRHSGRHGLLGWLCPHPAALGFPSARNVHW